MYTRQSTSIPAPLAREDHPVNEAIVDAVADAEGVSPLEVHPPLGTVIDPDALETLVASVDRSSDDSVVVEFSYSGYSVAITGSGDVSVSERDARD